MSQRLMSLLECQAEELEIYSIDEAFACLSRPADGDLSAWAKQLRARIKQNLGLPIAVGLGQSKSQAKLANQLAKRIPVHAGVFDLGRCPDPDLWLEAIAIEDVWGIGRKLSHWCRTRGSPMPGSCVTCPPGSCERRQGSWVGGCSRNSRARPVSPWT